MFAAILQGIVTGLILSIYIGPVFFYLLETSMNHGIKTALTVELGILVSDIFWIAAVSFAYVFLEELATQNWTYLAGGLIFIVVGIGSIKSKAAVAGINHAQKTKNKFLNGFLLNSTNPSVPVFWLGVSTLSMSHRDQVHPAFFYTTLLVTTTFFDVLKIIMANKVKKIINLQTQNLLKIIVGFVMIGFGILLIYKYITLVV